MDFVERIRTAINEAGLAVDSWEREEWDTQDPTLSEEYGRDLGFVAGLEAALRLVEKES